MSQFAINDVTPGESATLTFVVTGLQTSETISNATLEIRARSGAVLIPVKTVTVVSSSDGVINTVATVVSVVFNLTSSETVALHPQEPYYLFSVNITTSNGRKQAIVPIGRLSPIRGFPFVQPVRLGSVTTSIRLSSLVTGTKT